MTTLKAQMFISTMLGAVLLLIMGRYIMGEIRALKEKEPVVPVINVECTCDKVVDGAPLTEFAPEVKARYGFTDEDVYLLAQLVCGDKSIDGDGEYDIDYQHADNINYHEVSKVLSVVMNRQRHASFPDTVRDIVLAKNQFSVMPKNLKAAPSERALLVVGEWCKAYDDYDNGVQVTPEDHIFFSGDGFINHTRA